jgi:hypothetical protein
MGKQTTRKFNSLNLKIGQEIVTLHFWQEINSKEGVGRGGAWERKKTMFLWWARTTKGKKKLLQGCDRRMETWKLSFQWWCWWCRGFFLAFFLFSCLFGDLELKFFSADIIWSCCVYYIVPRLVAERSSRRVFLYVHLIWSLLCVQKTQALQNEALRSF